MVCIRELEGEIESEIEKVKAKKCYSNEGVDTDFGKVEGLKLALELAKKIDQNNREVSHSST